MQSFSLKNITFTKDEVIINKKKKQIKCPIDNIKELNYTRITFLIFCLCMVLVIRLAGSK